MSETPAGQAALALVHEGWTRLNTQQPLAAWASWRRALRLDPGQLAAREALDRLTRAVELPASARAEYRFRTPDDRRRARWDLAFQGRDLSDLSAAGAAFGELATADPDDPDARYNQALCHAWLGRNTEAIAGLDDCVRLWAGSDPESAISAWRLAEILRQGEGAEPLADEFSHAFEIPGDADALHHALADTVVLRGLPSPIVATADAGRGDVAIDEWLDRDWPEPRESPPPRLAELPRVRAIVLRTARGLRLSIADPTQLRTVFEHLGELGVSEPIPTATPLPLALLDAAIWTIRVPAWVDDASRARLYREQVEDTYENRWIHRTRVGLDGKTPLEAAGGDRVLRAKVEAVIRLREELAERPSTVELYQGYPFDRLRRRLGLTPRNPDAIDPLDWGCMGGPDLDALDLDTLEDHALADAVLSAAALGDDGRTARFAARLVATRSPSLAWLDLREIFAPLVRQALADDSPGDALRRVAEAIEVDGSVQGGRHRAAFLTWQAELLSRLDEPDQAERVYRALMAESAFPASVALDGASTLIADGHPGPARTLAEAARALASERGDEPTVREADDFLHALDP